MKGVFDRLSAKLVYLRVKPFDVTTPEGRSAERYRLAAWAMVVNLASRFALMIVMVLSVSLTVGYLGSQRFGAWAVLSSIVAMLSFLDLGIGNAMINRVAHAMAAREARNQQQVIGGGIGLLAIIGGLAALLLAIISTLLPWGRLLHLTEPALVAEVTAGAQVLSILFGINLVSGGCMKVLVGQQRAHEAHGLTLVGALISCGTLTLAASHQSGIPVLLMAGFGIQALIGLLAVPLLASRGQLIFSGVGAAMRLERRPLLRTGGLFFFLQIGGMIGWGSDSLVLAAMRGAQEVAVLAIAQRLFQFASQPIMVFNAPLWAAFADASARGDKAFARRTLKRSMTISIAAAAGLSGTLLVLAPWVIPAWTGGEIQVPWTLLLAFAVWTIIESAGGAFAMYLNGTGLVREQLVVVLAFCVTALPLKLFGAYTYGPTGLVVATTVSYLLTVVLLYSTLMRKRVLRPLQDP